MEKVSWSSNCTILLRAGPLAGDRQRVLDTFAPLGVGGEGTARYGLVALSVPPQADLGAVKRILKAGEADGWWGFEEGCIGDDWVSAG